MTFRLVAIDLDGTLLNSAGIVSPRSRAALARAAASGILPVIVTARPPRRLRLLLGDSPVAGVAICANGALLYSMEEERMIGHHCLAPAVAERLVVELRQAAPGVLFAFEVDMAWCREPAFETPPSCLPTLGEHVDDALAFVSAPVAKILVSHPAMPFADLLAQVAGVGGEEVVVTHSGEVWAEVTAAGVDKARSLARLCEDLAIDRSQVIAFGDMPNDLSVLGWAGYAVAMGNAHPEVKAIAHEITLSNDDDGVALVLERLSETRSPSVRLAVQPLWESGYSK